MPAQDFTRPCTLYRVSFPFLSEVILKLRERACWAVLIATAVLVIAAASECSAQCPVGPETSRLSITMIPRQGEGGPEETDAIAGTATEVSAEDARVVIYAHAGDRWWIQPLADNPFSRIEAEGRWQVTTHLGFEYAALLVHKSYSPQNQLFVLPQLGGCVWALATVKGLPPQRATHGEMPNGPVRVVHFSGYDWAVKSDHTGPGPNFFSDAEENVNVDANGRLHLRITYRDGHWHCAEVVNQKSLGYGTYQFSIASSTEHLDPNIVLGLFTWSDDATFVHRELDVEISRWGRKDATDNAQFVVQPWDREGHIMRFAMPTAPGSIHSFAWGPQEIAFKSLTPDGRIIEQKVFSEGIPQAGGESPRINLWLVNGQPPLDNKPAEIILDRFDFSVEPNK